VPQLVVTILRLSASVSRDEIAALLLEVAEHLHFVVEAFPRAVAPERLVHASVVADANEGARGVFYFMHVGASANAAGTFCASATAGKGSMCKSHS
jgi:hypothetical protein